DGNALPRAHHEGLLAQVFSLTSRQYDNHFPPSFYFQNAVVLDYHDFQRLLELVFLNQVQSHQEPRLRDRQPLSAGPHDHTHLLLKSPHPASPLLPPEYTRVKYILDPRSCIHLEPISPNANPPYGKISSKPLLYKK